MGRGNRSPQPTWGPVKASIAPPGPRPKSSGTHFERHRTHLMEEKPEGLANIWGLQTLSFIAGAAVAAVRRAPVTEYRTEH